MSSASKICTYQCQPAVGGCATPRILTQETCPTPRIMTSTLVKGQSEKLKVSVRNNFPQELAQGFSDKEELEDFCKKKILCQNPRGLPALPLRIDIETCTHTEPLREMVHLNTIF